MEAFIHIDCGSGAGSPTPILLLSGNQVAIPNDRLASGCGAGMCPNHNFLPGLPNLLEQLDGPQPSL
jgi:hypothetical protein